MSDRYVQSTRQLVTRERPFVTRILYVTSGTCAFLHVVWLSIVGFLVWSHKEKIVALRAKAMERLGRRPGPKAVVMPGMETVTAPPLEVAPVTSPL